PHAEHAPASLAADRERLFEDVVERSAVVELLLELVGLGGELGVRQFLYPRLERIDLGDAGREPLDGAVVCSSEKPSGYPGEHEESVTPPKGECGSWGAVLERQSCSWNRSPGLSLRAVVVAC